MSTIDTLILHCKAKGVMEFITKKIPSKPQGKEVLVRTDYTVISPGTELSVIMATHTVRFNYPTVPGYLCEGTVEAVGAEVTKLKVGDYVRCDKSNMSHFHVHEDNCRVVTEKVKPGTASFAGLMAIPLRGIRNAKIKLGDSVLVFGLGPIGLFATMLAKMDGATTVIGVDPIASRRELALTLGADIVAAPEAVTTTVKNSTQDGCDVVVDATGTNKVISGALQYAVNFGRVIILGGIHGNAELDFYTYFQKRNLTMIGCGTNRPDDFPYDNALTEEKVITKMIERGMIDPYPALKQAVVKDAVACYNHLINRDSDVITYCIDWSDAASVLNNV